jgi:predicted SAM-dependent methyltransferase
VKLNLGSAAADTGKYRTGWVNVDLYPYDGVQIVGSGLCLPFRDNTFSVVQAVHVLEHLPRDKFPIMLKEMARVVKPKDGWVYVEVPNFPQVVELLYHAYRMGDDNSIHQWRTSIYGKTEKPGMAHHFGFDEFTLKRYMVKAGLSGFERLTNRKDMISNHYTLEPVLLIKARKL